MAGTDKRKQSLYFLDDMLREIMGEAVRLDRSLSWLVQRAWRLASEEVRKFPSMAHIHLIDAPETGARAPRHGPAPSPEAQPAAVPERQPGSQVREFLSGKFEHN